MFFFWTIFFCDLLMPIILLFAGYAMHKSAPSKINHVFGYRTSRSMQNTDTWNFAHRYCGKLWFRLGLILLPLSVAAQLPFMRSSNSVVGIMSLILCTVQISILLLSILLTEQALKRTFTDDGRRR